MHELQGRRVLLTGATSGLGPGLAHALHLAGMRLVLSGRRPEALELLRRELVDSEAVLADRTKRTEV